MPGLLFEMRGEEMYEMNIKVEEILAAYEPEEVARLQQEWGEIIVDWLPNASPEMRRKALSYFRPEEIIASLKPEERLSGLKPEERLSGLKPEERLAGMSATEREQLFRDLEKQFKPAK